MKPPEKTKRELVEPLKVANDLELWHSLQRAGINHLNELAKQISEISAQPGNLVLIHAYPFRVANDIQSILLSGMDVCTHLQLSRLYFLSSQAAAIDFLEFIVQEFPFDVAEVRTGTHVLFTDESIRQAEHRFTNAATRLGIHHSLTANVADSGILAILRTYFYARCLSGMQAGVEQSVLADIRRFLYFHNNHRSLLTLGGKTPIQMLRSFPQFNDIRVFDPPTLTQREEHREGSSEFISR